MADAKEKWVVREGKDWMELQRVDPQGQLWVVLDGTVGMPGDIVRLPRLRNFVGTGAAAREAPLSPFEAELVVDPVTRSVLLPESGKPSDPQGQALALLKTLKTAGLKDQARVVWDWMRSTMGDSRREERDAA